LRPADEVKDDAAMNDTILTLKVRGKRDVLRARQRVRQIARLLGYEPLEQSWIAACAFEMARNGARSGRGASLVIYLEGSLLRMVLSGSNLQISNYRPCLFSLPNKPSTLDRYDLPWIVDQLNRFTPLNLFEEFQQQNHEILQLSTLLGRYHGRANRSESAA
jgi:hypothetical protein